MARQFIRKAAFFVAAALISTAAAAEVSVGKPAPDFTGTDVLSGEPVSLSDYKGKLVVLEWHNEGCPFVKKFYSVRAMQQLQKNAAEKGVVWITVNSSAEGKQGHYATAEDAKKYLTAKGAVPAHYIADTSGKIGHLYDAKTTPHMFVIDKEGTLAYMGAIDDTPTADSADIASAKNYVTRALRALNEGKPVAVTSTRPYGCGVKYN